MFTTFAAFAPFAATRSRAGTRAGQMRGHRIGGARYPRDRNVAAATHSDITARRYMCCCRPSGRGDEGGARSKGRFAGGERRRGRSAIYRGGIRDTHRVRTDRRGSAYRSLTHGLSQHDVAAPRASHHCDSKGVAPLLIALGSSSALPGDVLALTTVRSFERPHSRPFAPTRARTMQCTHHCLSPRPHALWF